MWEGLLSANKVYGVCTSTIMCWLDNNLARQWQNWIDTANSITLLNEANGLNAEWGLMCANSTTEITSQVERRRIWSHRWQSNNIWAYFVHGNNHLSNWKLLFRLLVCRATYSKRCLSARQLQRECIRHVSQFIVRTQIPLINHSAGCANQTNPTNWKKE